MNDPFAQLIGYSAIKKELNLYLDSLKNKACYEALGAKPERALLFSGEPGTGKTSFAKAFLSASGRPSYLLQKKGSDQDFLKAIVDVFEEAEKNAPSILLLDDLDKFADTEGRDDCNADAFVTVQTCFDALEGKDVFLIATTNNLHALPHSLLRAQRFGKILEFQAPDGRNEEAIIRYYLSKFPSLKAIDFELVGRLLQGCSCAEISDVIANAGMLAAYHRHSSISNDEVVEAALKFIYHSYENEETKDPAYEYEAAIHESSHTLVQELLEPGSVTFVSIKPFEGQNQGLTALAQSENYFKDIRFMENRITTLLAGKAGTELFLGKEDVGAADDLARAIKITRRFDNDYSFSSCPAGPVYQDLTSDELKARQEERLHSRLCHFYEDARKLLSENEGKVCSLAELLIQKKIVFFREIEALFQEGKASEEGGSTPSLSGNATFAATKK